MIYKKNVIYVILFIKNISFKLFIDRLNCYYDYYYYDYYYCQ